MAESSSQISSSPKITPKEEPNTYDRPKSLNPYLPADQDEFTFDEITFTTNNEVSLIYLDHPNSEYFQIISNFILKYCLREAFTIASTQYVEYLVEFWNALRAHYLPHLNEYVSPPSLAAVRPWFATIRRNGEIGAKGTLNKSCLPPRKKHSKHNLGSKKEATKIQPSSKEVAHSPTGHSKKKKKSGTSKDKATSHPSFSTPVDTELHKEDLQAAGDPISLGVASEEGAHPLLSSGCDASADSIVEADLGIYAPNDPIPSQ
ncbi:hypothetical protein Tco_1510629 [Tanacetum coccineum]